ncbi:extracellular solute-binding protein [Paenibacillus sp. YN15]|uniref:extracellular solute-binding protein n=1 Tax=Paenibacillus sp. YN15 TaxID=1742774 RepID=UPI000DCEAA27|nr:extracellular solute-binding protein [Paenibacillus sp. YN15]RAU99519.1 hypothetical protein DQG13_15595 [Paenibacillus sp. YN15]
MVKFKRAWKPVFATLVSLSLAVLAACGSSSTPGGSTAKSEGNASPPVAPTSQASSASSAGPKLEITASAFDRGEIAAEEGTYENNRWTRWINENSPTKVKWVPVVRNEFQKKMNTLIASGSAPDLIWEYDRNYIAQLANQGAIQPIDKYIEKYSTTYKKYLEEHPALKPLVTFDGKMYAVTSQRSTDSIVNHGMWIRQDWLDKLGLKMPTTIEELIEVAKKFRDEDPDGNGKADTVPIAFTGNANGIIRAFFFTHEDQWYLEDGQMKYGRLLDRYTDAIAFNKLLYDEKLIDREYITDKNFQHGLQLWVTGKAGIYMGTWNMDKEYLDLKKNVPDAQYAPLGSVATKYGTNGLYQESPADIFTAFNANMKEDEIEAAIKFLDWMLESGYMALKFGEENTHYTLVNGEIPKKTDEEKFSKEVRYARAYLMISGWKSNPEWYPIIAPSDPLAQENAKIKASALDVALKNTYRRDTAYGPTMPEVTQLVATFRPIALQIETQAIMGGSGKTPEAAMENMRKEWKRLGGENVEKLVQEWYEANKKNL